MRKIFLFLLPIFAVIYGDSSDLRVGFGGSMVGQKYSILEQDTISITTEPKILADGSYSFDLKSHKFSSEFSSDIGGESFWGNIRLKWKYKIGEFRTEMSEIIEGRAPYSKDNDIVGYFKHRFSLELGQKMDLKKLSARVWVEGKNYSQIGEFYYDYDLLRSRLSYEFPLLEGDGNISWNYSFRSVPDSADANYDRRQLELSYAKLWKAGHFSDLLIGYDRKHFPSEDESGSYSSLYFWSNQSILLGGIFIEPKIDFEKRVYDTEDDIFFDYTYLELEPMVQRDFDSWRLGVGPIYSSQWAKSQYAGESFNEFGIGVSANHLNYGVFWLFADIDFGKRFYSDVPDTESFLSDYLFVDVSGMVSVWFAKKIRADLSVSYSPEWHTRKGDNIQTSYISLEVRYEFGK